MGVESVCAVMKLPTALQESLLNVFNVSTDVVHLKSHKKRLYTEG